MESPLKVISVGGAIYYVQDWQESSFDWGKFVKDPRTKSTGLKMLVLGFLLIIPGAITFVVEAATRSGPPYYVYHLYPSTL